MKKNPNRKSKPFRIETRIQKAEEKKKKIEAVLELCNKVSWFFDMTSNQGLTEGPELFNLINEIYPWEQIIPDSDDPNMDRFHEIYTAMHVAFGFGYALGQMLDIPEIDIRPIKELLREKKAVIYLPHEKAA
jgi:hypothetical protein